MPAVAKSPSTDRRSAYDAAFFQEMQAGSLQSAAIIVPLIMELARPASVVDVGCGPGTWLNAFKAHGVARVRGFDGPWVNRSRLLIEPEEFTEVDLRTLRSLPQRFDLAVCLEVGEHLPTRASAQLVAALTDAAPLVLFSAAVPGQTGTLHINEQWPAFWQRLFVQRGYARLDPVRRKVVTDNRVEWWYRQNVFLYASKSAIESSAALQAEHKYAQENAIDYIHADILARYTSVRGLMRELPKAGWRAIKRVVGRCRGWSR